MNGFSTSQGIIAAMITPALLMLAAGSLIGIALARLGRVVDRVRRLVEAGCTAEMREALRRHRRRALLAERAVQIFFVSILCFVGAGFGIGLDHVTEGRTAWLPVSLTIMGMVLILVGSTAMLAECRLAVQQIRQEIAPELDG